MTALHERPPSERSRIVRSHFILYVADQAASTAFYARVLEMEPTLDVPGMTEFTLGSGSVLGLMPYAGIQRLLGSAIADRSRSSGSLGAELYLLVDEPAAFHARALEAGARELSPLTERDWGHVAAYSMDVDGNVLVFASETRRAEALP